MNTQQVEELILQSLEHELGGVKVYTTAIGCAVNADVKQEWAQYLEQTQAHVTALEAVCQAFGIDPAKETPGRQVVRHVGVAADVLAQPVHDQHGPARGLRRGPVLDMKRLAVGGGERCVHGPAV